MEIKKEEPRIVRLSRDEDGTEVWLDTETGQQLTGVVERQPAIVPHQLIAAATKVLDEFEWRYELVSAHQVSCVVGGHHADFNLDLLAYDSRLILLFMVGTPVQYPRRSVGARWSF